jgi:hypothetical protein
MCRRIVCELSHSVERILEVRAEKHSAFMLVCLRIGPMLLRAAYKSHQLDKSPIAHWTHAIYVRWIHITLGADVFLS